ncbi:MAG: hypothetical protein K0Q49_2515 [Haloplasmataceae bacterium]|jgi:hypothetical protein|nr:hypothetical protein [Haloplasmataceae bacterium]
MISLLNQGDIFIDLIIGTDLGYNDSITIKTKDCIDDKLYNLTKDFSNKVKKYEEENSDIKQLRILLFTLINYLM